MNKISRFVLYFLLLVPQIFICYFLYQFKVDINLIKLSIKDNKVKIVLFDKCENKPKIVYLKPPKGEVLQMERCVKLDDKLNFAKVAPQKEGGKYVFDEENFFNLVQNAANLRNAYEELKVCYTNQVDYYVAVANL